MTYVILERDMSANARDFTLTSAGGVVVAVTNYGGIILSVLAPDRDGHLADVVLGHDTVDRLPRESGLPRRHHRPLRQPDRAAPDSPWTVRRIT